MLLATAFLGAISNCTPSTTGSTQEPTTTETSLAKGPQRVLSLTLLGDEILYDLGPKARIKTIGVSMLTDDKRYHSTAGRWPSDVPRVHTRSEDVLTIRPDLVVVASFTATEIVAALRGAGTSVLRLGSMNGAADYRRNIRNVATALQLPAEGEALVDSFDARLKQVANKAQSKTPKPRVLSSFSGMVPGAHTSFNDVLNLCGAQNAATHEGFKRITAEKIILMDPDFIVVPEHTTNDPTILATRAARLGHVIPISTAILTSSGRGIADLAGTLCRALRAPQP